MLNAALDVDSATGLITEEARTVIGAHLAVTTMAPTPGLPVTPVAVELSDHLEPWRDRPPEAFTSGLEAQIARGLRPVRLTQAELEAHPSWAGRAALDGDGRPPMRGLLGAPLIGRDGRNLGVVQLSDKIDGDFTEDDEAIVVQLAQMASVALENARLYQELRENDRRKDEFLAMLAHELRNPLAAVSNAVAVARRGQGSEDALDWGLDVVDRQVRHLARLIDDLLDVSRITRGKIRLRKGPIDVLGVVRGASEVVRPLVEDRKHELILTVPPGPVLAEADPTRLEQILVNLLTNAAKYTPSGGTIRLEVRRERAEIVFRVEDNGVGIAPEQLPGMFVLFAQGDRSLARSEGGLGIGLTLVRALAEMHGGSIAAFSDGPGHGSQFEVRLPAASTTRPAPPVHPSVDPPQAHCARVLVVDDNLDTAEGMVRLLRLLGHEVRMAHDGPSALEEARRFRPSHILLDIGLPGMDGYEIALRLRSEAGVKHAIIIAISGYGEEDARKRGREAGFDHHLVKPVDYETLLRLLAAADPRD